MKSKLGIIGIVKNELEEDRPGTLRRLRSLGYSGIELGAANIEKSGGTAAWAADLKAADMEMITCHLIRETLRDTFDSTLSLIKAMHCKFACISWAPTDSIEQLREDAKFYNEVGTRLHDEGIRLCYHNHEHELSTRFGGRTALDILMDTAKPEALSLQLDVAWATYGGIDPVALLQRYAGRVPLVHLKDLYHNGPRGCFTAPGTGMVDIHGCLRAAHEGGGSWFTVEQDKPRRLQGFDLATAALLNLRELGLDPI